jgi:glycosyltransferase involved in cell wall biosynthesis
MAKFTIGIPTYNRALYLGRALKSACDQTLPDVEVLVSDNASTDETPDVVRSFGDRVRYHRNGENIGMWPNFAQLAQMAGGEYFSWLQDDDLIHSDFAMRAFEGFASGKNVVMYSAFVSYNPSPETFVRAKLYGPPIALDWMHSKTRVVDGFLVVPISFFTSFSIPPATAYRTETIRRAVQDVDPGDLLYNERIIQTRAAALGDVAVDPWPAAIFFAHEFQAHLVSGHLDVQERSRQWVRMARVLCTMLEERAESDWRAHLARWLDDVAPQDCEYFLNALLPPRRYWSEAHPVAEEICSQLLTRVPDHARSEYLARMDVEDGLDGDLRRQGEPGSPLKDFARGLTPPFFWDVLRKLKRSGKAVSD